MNLSIEQLLYHEARLLDAGMFQEWLELLAPDLRYWAPVRAEVEREREAAEQDERLLLFDETRTSLALRVSRLNTGAAWVDIPSTRTRRFIANIAATNESDGVVQVTSNFMIFKSRSFRDETLLVGCREDRWSLAGNWRLHERKILIDHCVVENLSIFL